MFILAAVSLALTACGTNEQSLEGMIIVTFKFNGGVLDTGATNVTGEIYHGYNPNAKVIDINEKFSLFRDGYVFDGWYEDEQLNVKWDFTKPVTQDITLYAKWKSAIVYSYSVYLIDGDNEPRKLGQYEVEKDAAFADSRNYGKSLAQYDKTFLGYYSDKALTAEWDNSFVHPGGEESRDVPVYVKAMDGVWTFVSDYDELKSAVAANANIWLKDNVDCQGDELYFANNRDEFGGKLNGNNYVISNFKITKEGSTWQPSFTLFGKLQNGASIVDVNFEDVQFVIDVDDKLVQSGLVKDVRVAALAVSAEEGCVVNNVSVTGTYTNATSFTLDKINSAFYDEELTVETTAFTANITEKVG